ncbi:hypothetical protein CLIBASIA_03725 [Candidatus Liberibacter asiaticus str. psy62]|uniref:Uncharacterized protein n=1 Tax=Liberibacter asiaticus (strain psy62) TaxID=537021 RepID=C6XG20_LIBAP|nr:hypothetical protein CLIBASIA_03725 [Candidatus Liberibacter asiaticus str. psy62]BAP26609.1 hypothetical protein CGUJ_03725 [Candidatus Liberibacter asiaticus str. Ishi-1]
MDTGCEQEVGGALLETRNLPMGQFSDWKDR